MGINLALCRVALEDSECTGGRSSVVTVSFIRGTKMAGYWLVVDFKTALPPPHLFLHLLPKFMNSKGSQSAPEKLPNTSDFDRLPIFNAENVLFSQLHFSPAERLTEVSLSP